MANPKRSVELVSALVIKDHMALTFNNEFPPFEGTKGLPFTTIGREPETSKKALVRMMKDYYGVEALPSFLMGLENHYEDETMYIIQLYFVSIKGSINSPLQFGWSSKKSFERDAKIMSPIVKLNLPHILDALKKDGKFI